MSLGDVTKCDLSFGEAKLDYNELKHVLRSHFLSKIKELKKTTDSYFEDGDSNYTPAFLCTVHGKQLEFIVESIRRTAELLYTLEQSNPFEKENKRTITWEGKL